MSSIVFLLSPPATKKSCAHYVLNVVSQFNRYIGRVKLALATCQDVYLRPVPRSALATSYIRQFAQAIAVMFTRHASLLKPLSEPGSIRVASDAAELEMALNTLADSRGLQLDSSELQFLKQLLFVQSRTLRPCHFCWDLVTALRALLVHSQCCSFGRTSNCRHSCSVTASWCGCASQHRVASFICPGVSAFAVSNATSICHDAFDPFCAAPATLRPFLRRELLPLGV